MIRYANMERDSSIVSAGAGAYSCVWVGVEAGGAQEHTDLIRNIGKTPLTYTHTSFGYVIGVLA